MDIRISKDLQGAIQDVWWAIGDSYPNDISNLDAIEECMSEEKINKYGCSAEAVVEFRNLILTNTTEDLADAFNDEINLER